MATVVHLWLERRTVVSLVTKVFPERGGRENYKIETKKELIDDIRPYGTY
jgi:hypothetical protein